MHRKVVAVWVSIFIIVSSIVILVEIADRVEAPTTLYVGGGGGGNYSKIQWAIDNASGGDTVFVYSGTYYENVVVNKSINLIGEDKYNTIINGSRKGDAIHISSDRVNVTDFTIEYSGWFSGLSGIRLNGVENCSLINNRIFNCGNGINIISSFNNNITNNYVTKNYGSIRLESSTHNKLIQNIVTTNTHGIWLYKASNNHVFNNFVKSLNNGININSNSNENQIFNNELPDQFDGVHIDDNSHRNVISNNTIYDNSGDGIYIRYSQNTVVSDNNISYNRGMGIYLSYSKGHILTGNSMIRNSIFIGANTLENWNTHFIDTSNTVNGKPVYYWKNQTVGIIPQGAGEVILANCSNIIVENQNLTQGSHGILLGYSSNNKIKDNLISSNTWDGIYLWESDQNQFIGNFITYNWRGILMKVSDDLVLYHNSFISNSLVHVIVDNSLNSVWDDGSEGNYWDDYNGVDNGSGGRTAGDGVGDTEIPHPYTNQGNGYYQLDNYPLMNPSRNSMALNGGWNFISLPFIQIDTNLTSVFSSINGSYDAIQYYKSEDKIDPWKHHKIDKSFGNKLSRLNETMGFWIHVTVLGGVLFEYTGTPPASNQTIQLHLGWNMVGYPSLTKHNRTVGLNNLTFDTHVDAIQWYDAATKTWHFMGPDDPFVPGRGYWVHSKVKTTWEVPL
jgi:parallel beta-helix repeat protein